MTPRIVPVAHTWTPDIAELTLAYRRAHGEGYGQNDVITYDQIYQLMLELAAAEQALFDLTNGRQGSNWRPAHLSSGPKELTP